MRIGDPVYVTDDNCIYIPKKPNRLQRLKWLIGRKFNIKRWQPKGPFIGIATSAGDSEGWVNVAIHSAITMNVTPEMEDEYRTALDRTFSIVLGDENET
jgi:hypothetical protein